MINDISNVPPLFAQILGRHFRLKGNPESEASSTGLSTAFVDKALGWGFVGRRVGAGETIA
jgi:hypothetical protein